MTCDDSLFTPLRWACRNMHSYDTYSRGNDLLLKDVSPAYVTFLGIVCILAMIVVVIFAFTHQRD